LGSFGRGEMVPEFDAAVFDIGETVPTPLGTVIGPVKTTFGHHLIKVVERDGFNGDNE
jgi:peptidyl-prolyl cis-trans isomerase C